MLTEQARQHIQSLGDDELVLCVISGTQIYDEEAIQFARQELERRRLEPTRIAELEASTVTRINAMEESKRAEAEEPFDAWERFYTFLGGPLFFGRLLFEWLGHDLAGRQRRAQQTLQYGCLGIIFWWLVIVLAVYLAR
jgi:hypothetical protein